MLIACQGQLRLAPSGHVTGIDMSTALELCAALGGNLAALSELLPAAEAGLVEALYGDAGRHGQGVCRGLGIPFAAAAAAIATNRSDSEPCLDAR